MPGEKVTYEIVLKRPNEVPALEVWNKTQIAMSVDDLSAVQQEEIYLDECRRMWRSLHRAIRLHEVSEE